VVKKFLVFSLILILLILASINAYLINPFQLSIREEIRIDERLPKEFDDTLIMYISDLHFGVSDQRIVDQLSEKTSNIAPDIIIYGGDLVDSSLSNLTVVERENLVSALTNMSATYGKYAVLGDEDNYTAINILEEAGFKILQNEEIYIYKGDSKIKLIGLNTGSQKSAIEGLFSGDDYTIVAAHYPDSFLQINQSKTSLMLAGHSLGGQVFLPLLSNSSEQGAQTYYRGEYNENDCVLSITNGLGCKDQNIRFLADAEILLWRLDYPY